MPLTSDQIETLRKAVAEYAFPAVYYDFGAELEVTAKRMCEVENYVSSQLRHNQLDVVKNGLSNVLYWGYANSGYRDHRVAAFRDDVSKDQLKEFAALVAQGNTPRLVEVANIKMPQFSGVAFVSKILMFLDPQHHCVLDQKIVQLVTPQGGKALYQLKCSYSMGVTTQNQKAYDGWRAECSALGAGYFKPALRAADIERGLFHLIDRRRQAEASQIYHRY